MDLLDRDLSYLKEPRFIGFGQDIFRNSTRLPVLGAILEITPNPEDRFRPVHVVNITDIDKGNIYYELQDLIRINMLDKHESLNPLWRTYGKIESAKWDIARLAVQSAREQLGL